MNKAYLWLVEKCRHDKVFVRILAGVGISLLFGLLYLKYLLMKGKIEKAEVKEVLEDEAKKDSQLSKDLDNLNRKEEKIDEIVKDSKAVVKLQKEAIDKVNDSHEARKKAIESVESWDDVDRLLKK